MVRCYPTLQISEKSPVIRTSASDPLPKDLSAGNQNDAVIVSYDNSHARAVTQR